MRTKFKKYCLVCRAKFCVSKYRNNDAKFCSQRCHGISRRLKRVKKSCAVCGKLYMAKINSSRRSRLCSKKCITKMGLGFYTGVTTVYCGYCDKALIRRTSELKGSGHFCNRTCSTRYLNLQSYKNGPNKSEIYLGEMLRSYHFSFVGDGKFFLGARNPDFVNRRRRLVVELFGEHWHDQEDVNRVKRNHAQYGYQTLVIWFRHLKSTRLRNRIEKFVAGGEE